MRYSVPRYPPCETSLPPPRESRSGIDHDTAYQKFDDPLHGRRDDWLATKFHINLLSAVCEIPTTEIGRGRGMEGKRGMGDEEGVGWLGQGCGARAAEVRKEGGPANGPVDDGQSRWPWSVSNSGGRKQNMDIATRPQADIDHGVRTRLSSAWTDNRCVNGSAPSNHAKMVKRHLEDHGLLNLGELCHVRSLTWCMVTMARSKFTMSGEHLPRKTYIQYLIHGTLSA